MCVHACSRDESGAVILKVMLFRLAQVKEGECIPCINKRVLFVRPVHSVHVPFVCACVLKGWNWCGERHSGGVGLQR
jgi:hypothetical protein